MWTMPSSAVTIFAMLVEGCRPADRWRVVDTTEASPEAAASARFGG